MDVCKVMIFSHAKADEQTLRFSWVLLTRTWYPAAANSPASAHKAPSIETSLSLAVDSATPAQMGTRVNSSLNGRATYQFPRLTGSGARIGRGGDEDVQLLGTGTKQYFWGYLW